MRSCWTSRWRAARDGDHSAHGGEEAFFSFFGCPFLLTLWQNMFDDLDLGLGAGSSATAAPATAAAAKTAAVVQEVAELDASSFGMDLDAMLEAAERQQRWKNAFGAGERVEAVYSEDGMWYAAVIDAVLPETGQYCVTFTEYGNSEQRGEDCIRLPVAAMLERKQEELKEAVEAEMAKKKKLRDSYLEKHPEVARPAMTPASTPPDSPLPNKSEAAAQLIRRGSMNKMSATFDHIVQDTAPGVAPQYLSSGVMSAEERKALILAEARKMGMESSGERTLVALEPRGGSPVGTPTATSLSDRRPESKRPKDLADAKRAGRSSSFSGGGSVRMVAAGAGKPAMRSAEGEGLFGDVEALLAAEELRRARSGSVGGEDERKVWASNPLTRKL